VIHGFLGDCEGRVKPKTLLWYRDFLLPFVGRHGTLAAEELTPTLVESYSRRPSWSHSTRNDFLGALVTAFRWAVRAKLICSSPLEGIRRPPKESRGVGAVVTEDEYTRLLLAASPPFRLFLRVLWASGARPGEVAAITAENFDEKAGAVLLRDHKTAHKGKTRVIWLAPEVAALLVELKAIHPAGPLLRTSKGNVWTCLIIGRARREARRKAGVPHAMAYGLRHSFATDALANGVPHAHVAELLGHSNTNMLHRHYAHLGTKARALKEALGRVRRGEGPPDGHTGDARESGAA
jgi:integrase